MTLSRNELRSQYFQQDHPSHWFEILYANANGDGSAVPWANLKASRDVLEWLERHQIDGQGQKALVVACGLGDDAEELARRGFEVTAFDISPTAIEWCRQRFPDSAVNYQVADLFNSPQTWHSNYDFILEYFTIQALPPAMAEETIQAITQHVAPNGKILVITLGRDAEIDVSGPPWPLSREMLGAFKQLGLTEIEFEAHGVISQTLRFTDFEYNTRTVKLMMSAIQIAETLDHD